MLLQVSLLYELEHQQLVQLVAHLLHTHRYVQGGSLILPRFIQAAACPHADQTISSYFRMPCASTHLSVLPCGIVVALSKYSKALLKVSLESLNKPNALLQL